MSKTQRVEVAMLLECKTRKHSFLLWRGCNGRAGTWTFLGLGKEEAEDRNSSSGPSLIGKLVLC